MNQVRIKTYKAQVSSIFVQRSLWESYSKFCKFFSLISLLLKIICKSLSVSPTEVSGPKCLKLELSKFLSLLDSLPLRKSCTSFTGFRNIGVKSWVLVLKSLGVWLFPFVSVAKWFLFLLLFFVLPPLLKLILKSIKTKQTYTYTDPINPI